MFDHVGIHVRDLDAAKQFYATVLAPLGISLTAEDEKYVEFGALSIGTSAPAPPIHFAFIAETREQVDGFHRAGVEAGYRDNGAPGIREYADDYYAAYLLDPDGNNVEAVHRSPETRSRWNWLGRGIAARPARSADPIEGFSRKYFPAKRSLRGIQIRVSPEKE